MIVQQLVVIPVFSQEGVSARPSTPSWTNLQIVLIGVLVGLFSLASKEQIKLELEKEKER